MSVLSSSYRARLLERLETKESQLAALYQSFDELVQNNVEEYRFNSGEGNQWARRRTLRSLQDAIEKLESEIENLRRRLQSGGIVNITLRRKGGFGQY
jgi:DNA repair exonuclease SbcCD ATPase subunit